MLNFDFLENGLALLSPPLVSLRDQKGQDKNLNILNTKRAFKMKDCQLSKLFQTRDLAFKLKIMLY